MNPRTIKIIDPCRTVVATAQVVKKDERFTGWVDLHAMPLNLRQLFDEYEEIVNDQLFSFLDEIEEQVTALQLRVSFDGGEEANIEDLQIYPTTRRISFRLVEEPIRLAIKEQLPADRSSLLTVHPPR